MFIAQPVGNLLSGLLSEPFGRKLSMYLGSIAHIIAYCLFYVGSSISMIFVAFTLLGIGVGITEAPNNQYLGEVKYVISTTNRIMSQASRSRFADTPVHTHTHIKEAKCSTIFLYISLSLQWTICAWANDVMCRFGGESRPILGVLAGGDYGLAFGIIDLCHIPDDHAHFVVHGEYPTISYGLCPLPFN